MKDLPFGIFLHHDPEALKPPHGGPVWTIHDYEATLSSDVDLIGGICVEAIAPNAMDEAKWFEEELSKSSLTYGFVAGVDLMRDISDHTINLKKLSRFRGMRHILNFELRDLHVSLFFADGGSQRASLLSLRYHVLACASYPI